MFLKDLREAWRIVRISRDDGYKGSFVVLRETMIEEVQMVYGRVLAENMHYQDALYDALCNRSVCKYCEDYNECKAEGKGDHSCGDFILAFPEDEEAAESFNNYYRQCADKVGAPHE